MSTLIIHPKDRSTTFLDIIYKGLHNKTVITGGVSQEDLIKMIPNYDRVMIMGHGSPGGLFAVGQFETERGYIVDRTFVDVLKDNPNNVYIWCNADEFIKRWELKGFFSGMFISEIEEAMYFDFWDVEASEIERSNDCFAKAVSKNINEPIKVMYKNVIQEYGLLALNPIVRFNLERLYINSDIKENNTICNTNYK